MCCHIFIGCRAPAQAGAGVKPLHQGPGLRRGTKRRWGGSFLFPATVPAAEDGPEHQHSGQEGDDDPGGDGGLLRRADGEAVGRGRRGGGGGAVWHRCQPFGRSPDGRRPGDGRGGNRRTAVDGWQTFAIFCQRASATIGRAAAVADIKGLKLSGLLAWITWLVVHLFYLVGFQNRLLVLIRWSIGFATRGRGTRLITNPANADAGRRPPAHPEPGSPLLMPPRVGSHPSQMR